MRHSFTYGNSFVAIEHACSEAKEHFHGLFLKKKKNEFIIANHKTTTALDSILDDIPKLTPVFITINNQHTLQKVAHQHFSSTKDAVNFCFPALEQDAFYITVAPVGASTLVTLCRKEIVSEIIAFYQSKNITLLSISLGNSNIYTLVPHLNTKSFYTSNFKIDIDSQHTKLTEIAPPQTSYLLNGLTLSNQYLLSLASLLTLYVKPEHRSNFAPLNAQLLKTFIHNRIYYYGLRTSIAFIFCLLLINSFLFITYQKKTNQLRQDLFLMQKDQSSRDLLKERLQDHKNLVTNLTENANSKVSYFLDEIGISVPKSVILNTLYYQLPLKKIKNDKKIEIDSNKIIISGTVNNSDDFTPWIRELSALSWIKSSRVIDYGTGKEKFISFSIELIL